MSVATAPCPRVACLTSKGQAAVALICLRDSLDQLGEFDRAALATVLRELADIYAPRRPDPAA